jgi:hypothetical protein
MTEDTAGTLKKSSSSFKGSASLTGFAMEAGQASISSMSTPSLTSRASTVVDQIYYDTPGKKLVLEWNDPHRFVYIPGMARPDRQGNSAYYASGSVQGSFPSSIQNKRASMQSGGITAATSDSFSRQAVQHSQRSTQESSVVVAVPDKTTGGYRISNLGEQRMGQQPQQYGQTRNVYSAASSQGVRSALSRTGNGGGSSGSVQVRMMPNGSYGYADGSAAGRQPSSGAGGGRGAAHQQTIAPSNVIRPASIQAPSRPTAPASSSRVVTQAEGMPSQQQAQKEQDGRRYVSQEVHC